MHVGGGTVPGASGDSTTTGSKPRPDLPVDSAISCSAQSPKPSMPEPESASTTLSRPSTPAPPSAAPSCRDGLPSVAASVCGQRVRVVEQPLDVHAGKRAGHQAEGRQRAVAAADVGVGEEDLTKTGVPRDLFQR